MTGQEKLLLQIHKMSIIEIVGLTTGDNCPSDFGMYICHDKSNCTKIKCSSCWETALISKMNDEY